jgi:HlyD family secretion protein
MAPCALVLIITVAGLLSLAGCQPAPSGVYAGYAEGEYVRIAAPNAGSLSVLHVRRGDQVEANAALFALEQESERAAREEAAARVDQAQAQLANLGKGKRPDEVAAVRAQLAQAQAALQLSSADMKRTASLVAQQFLSPAKLDEARSALERDRSRVAELAALLKVANLTSRPDEIAAAAAELQAAREQLAQAQWRLAQKSQRAPQAGVVTDTLYAAGEWVPAGMPVVALLPPQNIKLRFFVPETRVGTLKFGQDVRVSCDGCAALNAKLSYVSAQAEYTAPLIYSRENRATLVFMIEARTTPEDAVKLHPGQPVEIHL